MNILNDFGVNPILLVGQIVNFLIILFILKRFMYKPVLDILKKRETEIKQGLKDAEEADKKLLSAEQKEKQILQKARITAENILVNARLEADEFKAKKEEQTKAEAQRLLEQAKQTIEQETKAAEERLTVKIGEIAISLLEKSLTGIFGEKEQKLILKKAQSQLMKHE